MLTLRQCWIITTKIAVRVYIWFFGKIQRLIGYQISLIVIARQPKYHRFYALPPTQPIYLGLFKTRKTNLSVMFWDAGLRSPTRVFQNWHFEQMKAQFYYRTRVRSLAMFVTHWQTRSLPFSKLDWCDPGVWRYLLVEVVTVADNDDENRVCNSLLQIWMLRFGHKAKLLFRLSAQGLVRSLKLKFRRDFKAEVWSVFCCWCLVEVTKLNLGQDYEARFGQDFKFKFSQDADVWVEILKLMLSRDSEIEVWSRFVCNLWYELNPRVPCAFGNVSWSGGLPEIKSTLPHLTSENRWIDSWTSLGRNSPRLQEEKTLWGRRCGGGDQWRDGSLLGGTSSILRTFGRDQ